MALRNLKTLLAFIAGLAPPAQAEPWRCHFTAACPAGLACTGADHRAQIIAADHEGQLFLTLDGADHLARRLDETHRYSAHTRAAALLLTIAPDGTARLSRHDGAISVLFGSCEADGS
ncbi:hypothetical protein V8J82_14650 [Gymnodinialimonas sp. 2305UL16-5]|uniref:hypothetical protein n=1 Tax=Gymnodinialimonas mytili TaxID=3126503 RepID=UPI0030AA54D4